MNSSDTYAWVDVVDMCAVTRELFSNTPSVFGDNATLFLTYDFESGRGQGGYVVTVQSDKANLTTEITGVWKVHRELYRDWVITKMEGVGFEYAERKTNQCRLTKIEF